MALIRPFLFARDFALSIRFYQAIGFTLGYRGGDLAIFEAEGAGFLLQNRHVEAFAQNCMNQYCVADLDGWRCCTADLVERFAVRAPIAPAMQPWGIRVGFVFDPSDVLWQVSAPPGAC